jgi:Tol biopolymer transport system component
MNADGSGATQLTDTGAASTSPAWSPDASKIAYRNGTLGIWEMNWDGSGKIALTTNSGDDAPAWSPSGTQIVFSRTGALCGHEL